MLLQIRHCFSLIRRPSEWVGPSPLCDRNLAMSHGLTLLKGPSVSCRNASHVSRLSDGIEVDNVIIFQGESRMLPGAGSFGLHSVVVELDETGLDEAQSDISFPQACYPAIVIL